MEDMVPAQSVQVLIKIDGFPAAGGLLLDGEHPRIRQPAARIHIQRSQ